MKPSHRRFLSCAVASWMIVGTSYSQTRVTTGFLDRTIDFNGVDYRYQVFVPSNYDANTPLPAILFLHGIGERGADGLVQTQVGLPAAIRQKPGRYPAIVVLPQVPNDSIWTGDPAEAAMQALRHTMKEYSVDSNRIYLTGLSMGGNGAWYLAYRYASVFAAVSPICGWVDWPNPRTEHFAKVIPHASPDPYNDLAQALKNVPIWIFHGEEDNSVPVEQSRKAFDALKRAGSMALYTELPGIGHNAWDPAYGSLAFVEWLFAQRRVR